MKDNKKLEKLYSLSLQTINKTINSQEYKEKEIIKIILNLSMEKQVNIFENNCYNLDSISELFRFYEKELKDAFRDDQERFHLLFKIYLLKIELFTILCELFIYDKEKRRLIKPIFQLLKESKNLLKFFIPFEKKELNIINNIIGEQLYYFSHVHYVNLKDKSLDYIFEESLLTCESMLNGLELSISSNFGGNPYKTKEIEETIFLNNLSFYLLKMISKLKVFRPKINYFDNKNYLKILDFFYTIYIFEKSYNIDNKKPFKDTLLEIFIETSKFLTEEKKHDYLEEKIRLLSLNTDEYKELIDIISSLK